MHVLKFEARMPANKLACQMLNLSTKMVIRLTVSSDIFWRSFAQVHILMTVNIARPTSARVRRSDGYTLGFTGFQRYNSIYSDRTSICINP